MPLYSMKEKCPNGSNEIRSKNIMRKTVTNVMASMASVVMIMANVFPSYAADNVISSESESRAADVAVTATVASNFKVKLPMAIELKETKDASDFGPVFKSPESTKVGVQGILYGKCLKISVKDVRPNSLTYDKENLLTLGQATYDEKTGTYNVASEDGAVSADVDLAYHKFYPESYDVSGVEDATNIVPGGLSDVYTNYDFGVKTTSKVSADSNTLYYGKLTFCITTEDY